jgi:hypothetical protein
MFTVPGSPSGMKVTSNGDYLIAAYIGQVDSFKIDPITGDLTELGPFKTQGLLPESKLAATAPLRTLAMPHRRRRLRFSASARLES